MMNLLQPSGYCMSRQGQNLPLFSSHISFVFRTLISINSKYTTIQYSLIVFLLEEHCILGEENISIIARRNQKLQCTVMP